MTDALDLSTPAPAVFADSELTRSAAADYLDRANWDPDKARAMAAHEKLTNLGVHPDVVAQVVAPQIPPASPTQSVPPVRVAPSQPGRVVSLTPQPTPKPAAKTKPSANIDLSAGFVPKTTSAPPTVSGDDLDLSAGFVPLTNAPEDSGLLSAATRAGKTFAQGLGIPTSQEELEAAQPTLAEKIGGPVVTAGKMAYNYGKNLVDQGKDSLSEAYEAGENIGEGGPVAENIGKAGAAASDFVLKGALAPFGGAATAKAGEEFNTGDKLPEAIGDVGAAAVNAVTAKDLIKGKPVTTSEPIPGAPMTPGETAGPGVLRSGEQLVSKVGSAQKPVRDFMEARTKTIQDAAKTVAPTTATPEATGAAVQDAARNVIHGKEQAADLVDQFGERAKQQLETAKQAAADSEKTQTQAEAERQGAAMQDTAAQELDQRRVKSVSDAQDIAKAISGGHDELPVAEADRKIIDTLRSGNKEAKSEESAVHDSLTKAAKDRGVVVDTKPMQDVAKGVVELEGPARDLVTSSLPASVLKMLEKAAEGEAANSPLDPYAHAMTGHNYVELKGLVDSPPTGKAATRGAGGTYWGDALQKVEAEAAKDGIQPMEAGVPYDIMKTGRTAVRESLQGARKHFQQTGMGGNAVRVLQDLYGSMSDAMKKSLEPHPDLTKQFNEANSLTIDRTSKFVDPKFIRSLVYKGDSAKVIGAVMRSGGQVEAEALVKALGSDPLAIGPVKRAAMDFTLRRSMKTTTGELPGTVEASKLDYDLAVRNAEKTPALRTILGDTDYQRFLGDLEKKRLAARDPDEVRFDGYLQRVVKADSPEKAARLGTDQDNLAKLSQKNPDVVQRPIDTTAGAKTVSQAEQKLASAKSASDKLRTPNLPEKGVQKVAKSVSEDITPSGIIERAAKEPEYTDKLLQVIDKAPNPQQLRKQLGQRIFRNATDNAMVNGAFGSNNGVFDVGKFDAAYREARPSLSKILPAANVKAMDGFADALKQYTLSNGVGAQGGMSSRMLVMRQIMGISSLLRGVFTLNPALVATGVAVEAGPRLWMELATHPGLTRAVSESLRAGSEAIGAGSISEQTRQPHRDLRASNFSADTSSRSLATSSSEAPPPITQAQPAATKITQNQNMVEKGTTQPTAPPVPERVTNEKRKDKQRAAGLVEPGNIDLYNRPKISNPKGGTSTVYSTSFEEDGKEVLVPRAADGRILTEQEARDRYHRTGEHLGKFDTPEHATAYAKQLHQDYALGLYDKPTSGARGFDHPSRQADKEAGWKAALKSKNTPEHLKPHLEKNLSH